MPAMTTSSKGECAIVITATHAESVALCIEAKQRHQDEMHELRLTTFTGHECRFRNPVTVALHGMLRSPGREPQATLKKGMQHRQVTLLAHVMRQLQQRHGVGLALAADIGGDAPGIDEALLL